MKATAFTRAGIHAVAGQSANADENPTGTPWGCDAPHSVTVSLLGPNGTNLRGIYPCFSYKTIADTLDAKHVSWRYYEPAEDPKSPENGFDFIPVTFTPSFFIHLNPPRTFGSK